VQAARLHGLKVQAARLHYDATPTETLRGGAG
jgi:hypothetical protein